MGWGDEIMALGRLELYHAATGQKGAILNDIGLPRDNVLWHGHPAWEPKGTSGIKDGAGCRPYIKQWSQWNGQPRLVFNEAYRPRAGRIHLTNRERLVSAISGLYAVVSPTIKDNASVNKQWGVEKWEQVIAGFPIKVYQLGAEGTKPIKGARHFFTPTMRHAAAVIEGAALVLTNEGGMHHLAASFKRPAVVVFGAFAHPLVTGYPFHTNLAVETQEGYCGRYAPCDHCKEAMAQITPAMVQLEATKILEA